MKSLFFFLTLWTFLPLFAGYAPDNVQTALTKMYPSAKGIAWSQDEEYYVADFMMNGFDTKVWFNTDAEWVMKQTDWETLDEVPAAVFNAFAASQFSDGVVQNVVWVQFPKWQPIVAIQVGRLNVQIKYQILFTPKGEIKTMPQNSTALDFAFSLHTDIGSHCIGAKVNHKLVPLSHKLQSGDQVEVLTSKSQRVQPEWEAYATTARARAKIASILRKEAKAHQKEGEAILADFLRNEDIRMDDSAIDKLTRLHNFHTRDELFVAVGSKKLVLGDADRNAFKEKQSTNWKKFLTFSFGNKDNKDTKEQSEEKVPQEKINTKQILKLTEETIQKNYIMADCCHPIPGDDVLGYIDEQNRIIIHKRQCPVAARLKSSYGNRIIATEWDTHKELSFLVTIYLKGIDSMGLLNEVTQVISRQLNVNIRKLTIETTDGIFEGKIQLYVHDVDDVRSICDNLKQIQNIKQVTRIEG